MRNRFIFLTLSFVFLVTTTFSACGPSIEPTPIPTDSSNLTPTQILNNECADKGGDSDHDGLCNQTETDDPRLGPDCVNNANCLDPKTPDGKKLCGDTCKKVLVGVALAGYGLYKKCKDGEPGCDVNPFRTGSIGDGFDDPYVQGVPLPDWGNATVVSKFISSSGQTGFPYLSIDSQVGYEKDSKKHVYIGKSKLGDGAKFCIRGKTRLGEIRTETSPSAGEGDAVTRLEGNFKEAAEGPFFEEYTKSEFDTVCQNKIGAWIGYKKSTDLNSIWLVASLTPDMLGFNQSSDPKQQTSRETRIVFESLTGSPKIHFEDVSNPRVETQTYTFQVAQDTVSRAFDACDAASNEAECKMKAFLSVPSSTGNAQADATLRDNLPKAKKAETPRPDQT